MARQCAVPKTIIRNGKAVQVCDATRAELLPLLNEIQRKKGYIPDADMQTIADQLGIHPVEVYSVVTFYSFFSTEKHGRYCIRVSNCPSGMLSGSERVMRKFEKELGIRRGEKTSDGMFSLEMAGCIGMCDTAPAVLINDNLIGDLTPKKIKELIAVCRKKQPLPSLIRL